MKNFHAVLQNFFSDGLDDFRPTPSREAPEYGVYTALGPMVDDVRDGANVELLERLNSEDVAPPVASPAAPADPAPFAQPTYGQTVTRSATDIHLQAVIATRGQTVIVLRRRHQTEVTTKEQAASRKKWNWNTAIPQEAESTA